VQPTDEIESAKQIIDEANALLITAGAGMGVDSGLPDFRGTEGFWREYPVLKKLGYRFEYMANPKWFEENPKLAWAFYGHRLNLYRKTKPHKGFSLLLQLARKKGDDYFVYTSNVDGQFQKAGFDPEKIAEIHGSIHHLQCHIPCTKDIWSAQKTPDIPIDMERFEALEIPKCIHCDAVARPNILMFADYSWISSRSDTQEQRFENWLEEVHKNNKKLAIIEIGAGIAIPSIRHAGETIASSFSNATLIRINPRESDIDPNLGIGLAFGGLEALECIVAV